MSGYPPVMTSLLLLSLLDARAGPTHARCGTTPDDLAPAAQPALPGPPGELRDAYDVPNLQLTEHFALRWGDADPPSAAALSDIADALEDAWDAQVEGLGMPPPIGTDAGYRFNVYVGDSGSGAPSADGTGGYYTSSGRNGWPIIVLSQGVFDDTTYGRSVTAHELFHALQAATGNYRYAQDSDSAWFFEATAEWAAGETYRDDAIYAAFLAAFAFHPHYRLSYFNYPDAGLFVETYQYGAFIFPRYLSEVVGRPELVRDAWTDPGEATDPLDAIAAALGAGGEALLPLVADFYAHNAEWDYEDGDLYEDSIAYFGGFYSDEDHREVGRFSLEDGDGEWLLLEQTDLLPQRYGANLITLTSTDACGTLSIAFDGADSGAYGSPAAWAGVLALHDGSDHDYIPLADEETLTVELDNTRRRLTLVVVPEADSLQAAEVFDYAFAWTFTPAPDRDAAGCVDTPSGGSGTASPSSSGGGLGAPPSSGCNSGSRSSALPLLLPALLALPWSRRRRDEARRKCST